MKQYLFYITILFLPISIYGQAHKNIDPKFKQKIDGLLSETVPFKYVTDLELKDLDHYILLDAREWKEYSVSHIPSAKYIGYDQPDYSILDDLNKDSEIIIYCSIGYRSEKIGEELEKRGFSKVFNLYGSIFEWVNQGNYIEDLYGNQTYKIHTYNKHWSKWMKNTEYQKSGDTA